MNQQIREIRLLAGIACRSMSGMIETDSEQLEQFAQLIIARCAKICQDNPLYSGGTLAGMILQEFEGE